MGLSERKVKRRLVGSAVTSNSAWTANEALPGQRMLASMGWSQGEGLGVNQQGSAAPISVAFKLDNKGLGVARAEKEARSSGSKTGGMDWLGGGSDYEAVLQRINAANAAPAGTPVQLHEEAVTSDSDDDSDKDDAAAVKEPTGKGKGKKEKGQKKKSKRKASEDDDDDDNDTTDGKRRKKKSKKEDVTVTTVAVASVTPVASHRLAHRAKFLRAKGLLPSDFRSSPTSGTSTPVLLPNSAASSAPASPAPLPTSETEVDEVTRTSVTDTKAKKSSRKSKDGGNGASEEAKVEVVTSSSSTVVVTPSAGSDKLTEKERKRAEKAAAKESRKAEKRAAKEALSVAASITDTKTESQSSNATPSTTSSPAPPQPMVTDPLAEPVEPPASTMSVQTYLANKLLRRKAEIARAKREAEDAVWGRVSAIVATTTTTSA
ncbi:unnamed protein product [Tilletia controversa]|uniref:G-patch domain-containing protein n=1 Tax=Tilletia controversa TaxID=13291 RepID=A0A8X7SWB8_9BASI|nr:hypothetical protein CF328_g4186 [Tilletia controversa]KAE8246539.1 hypothetical protein A4X06_0g4975 [Tilletia controversa]CAD6910233.1 unnamed protein product [Tilletia controversa]CAD6933312.1 unnamed protein product [Tilletia controversa]CAD6951951.1 unnamed protein product [Tilletia controversa]